MNRVLLENRQLGDEAAITPELVVPTVAPDPARAAELLTDIQTQTKVVSAAEAKAMYSGGLEQAMANVRSLFHLAECHRDRSVQVVPQESLFVTETCKQFTKWAQS